MTTVYTRMPVSEVWTAWIRHMQVPAAVPVLAIVLAGLWAVRQQQRANPNATRATSCPCGQARRQLRRQSVLLEQSQRAAQIGAWELDVVSNELYWTGADLPYPRGSRPRTTAPAGKAPWDASPPTARPSSARPCGGGSPTASPGISSCS